MDRLAVKAEWSSPTFITFAPPAVWQWYVFGKGADEHHLMVVQTYAVPIWRRILTRIFLGSVWERINP